MITCDGKIEERIKSQSPKKTVRTKSSILMIIVNVARVLLCLHGSGRVRTYTLEGGKLVLGDHPKEGTLQTGP